MAIHTGAMLLELSAGGSGCGAGRISGIIEAAFWDCADRAGAGGSVSDSF